MGKILLRWVSILVILSMVTHLEVEASPKDRAKQRLSKDLPAINRRIDEWEAKMKRPDEFGVAFPSDVYQSQAAAILDNLRGNTKYRIDKISRHLKENKISKSSDSRWNDMMKDMGKRWKELERIYEDTMSRLRRTEYPKKYNELQKKAAEGDANAKEKMKKLEFIFQQENIPVPTPLPTTTPTTTVAIRRRPQAPGGFVKLPNGQVVPASHPAAAALNPAAAGGNPAVLGFKPAVAVGSGSGAAAVKPAMGSHAKPALSGAKPMAVPGLPPPPKLIVPVGAAVPGSNPGGPFANKNDLNVLIGNVEHPTAVGGANQVNQSKQGGKGLDKKIIGGAIGVVVLVVIAAIACLSGGGKKDEAQLPLTAPQQHPGAHRPLMPPRGPRRQPPLRKKSESSADSDESD